MERRSERSDSTRSETIVDARTSLALWLRAGRSQRGMSLEDVAKVTKIQPRILERLETGRPDGLPADVFVRGFVRSFARCVGLDEEEALRRYAACGMGGLAGPGTLSSLDRPSGTTGAEITSTARALVEAMADLVPGSATVARATPRRMHAVEVIDLAAGSLRDLPGSVLVETLVETMMLPETGTLVTSVAPTASLAEAMTDCETVEAVRAESLAVSDAVGEASLSAASTRAVAVEPAEIPSSTEATEATEATEPARSAEPTKKKRSRRGKGRNKRVTGGGETGFARDLLAIGTPAGASPVVTDAPSVPGSNESRDSAVRMAVAVIPAEAEAEAKAEIDAMVSDRAGSALATTETIPAIPVATTVAMPVATIDEPIATATWAPRMPPIAAAPSVPWRKPAYAASSAVAVAVPSLVIDDADPDSAERVLEERAEKHAPRRSFLPPILLDREDRSARQGGLTLAVIILLIAATLTLSYLMRRPSAAGDGMTQREAPAGAIDSPARG
jgi:Helix-turn-helix domain